MRYLSLFSGIEAATVAWHPLGWECVGVAEIEPFPCAVLAHHYPNVPNLGSVTDITEAQVKALGHIDIVVFGSPCQDLSVAGHRKGLINADGTVTRSGLFFTAINIARWSGARFWLWENVPGAFSSSQGRDFASVVEFMAGMDECPVPPKGWGNEGVAVGDNGLLEWATLDAQWFGVAQRRRRVFALLDTGAWFDRPPILLEPEGMRGDSPPRREKGERVADSLTVGANQCLGRQGDFVESVAARMVAFGEYVDDGTASAMKQRDYKDATDLIVAHTLRGNGFDASEDGTGRGTPLVPVANALTASRSSTQCPNEDTTLVPVTYGIPGNWIGRKPENGGNAVEPMVEVSPCQTSADRHGVVAPCLSASNNPSRSPQSSEVTQQVMAVMQATAVAFNHYRTDASPGECCPTLQVSKGSGAGGAAVATPMQVRRLTPVECERLQGFPDNYTNIPWRKQPTSPDGPRYKALGNSMAVPVMRWIGRQIDIAANLI